MSPSAPTPDIPGFAAAQDRLRTTLGRDVRFYGPAAMIYDPAIPASAFDSEGIPLDPLAGATATASAGVAIDNLTIVGSAQCNVVFKPLQTSLLRRDETQETALAIRSGINKDLIMSINDLALAEEAEYFMVGNFARDDSGAVIEPEQFTPDDGELWKIVNVKTDGFGGLQRVIVFGQGTL